MKHVDRVYGYSIRCGVPGCREETAAQTSEPFRTAERAVHGARALGWLHTRTPHGIAWVCPMHQAWDDRTGRWVPARRRQANA